MSKHKSNGQAKPSERTKQTVPDTGQGAAGDLGSDADVGENDGSGNNEPSKSDKEKSLIPIKRMDKKDASA
ncbi:hypothetical protein SanaruYs_05420 [Chryseotalea sanaruensis]|uniref:Uncharacterized protein n=1 Tax=Chryseotalea sanaruensis TaxID=2482724 RepID=A0A401U615_9BACT|nr:hypothetical protein [Chryseotalea sanaruensis]GCC50327.1 hypothetical protein SanaruYs_05420 [Chryseotalea sanaruensis]